MLFRGFLRFRFGRFWSGFCLQIGQETSPRGSDMWLSRGPQKKEKRMHKRHLGSFSYMVESVNLPLIFGPFCTLIPGVSKLVKILGCSVDLGVPERYPSCTFKVGKIDSTPKNSH